MRVAVIGCGRHATSSVYPALAPAYQRAKNLIDEDGFGPPTLGSFTFAMGPWQGPFGNLPGRQPGHIWTRLFPSRREYVQVSHVEAGPRRETCRRTRLGGGGRVLTLNLCTTASWHQHNESVDVFGHGRSVCVDDVDTCIYRPPEGPEGAWKPNYTVPLPVNTSGTTMGFVPELAHFRSVFRGSVPSNMASAGRPLALTEELIRATGAVGGR